MKEIILEFKKDKQAIDHSWEQPNTPWLLVPPSNYLEGYEAKLMLDYPKKQVYIKQWEGESEDFVEFWDFLFWHYGLFDYDNILKNNKEFFWDMVIDLKRNLNNKQTQKILFTIDKTQLGAKKI